MRILLGLGIAAAALTFPGAAQARLDLDRAQVARLDNGLTVILLEDHSLPVVSTQVIYRSGSRDETGGKTGLAHFMEHLSFRATRNFPAAAATRAIYDGGGEWHGYTWIDETAYFATMPREGLDLLLRIEADRMANVTIDPDAIAAEKGAVLTEMHGYENDPSSVLFDAIVAAALQVHPYRNNTIGYESDVRALTVADAKSYYAAHYRPANAVLAIVGDIDRAAALAQVRRYFGPIAPGAPAARTAAVEPPQRGERRVRLTGPVDRRYFKLAQPAPAASSPDLPAFLVLQQLVSGGSGVNFRQNDWGTPAVPGSALDGVTPDLTSWFIATADPYLFLISGSIDKTASEGALESAIGARLARLRSAPPTPEVLARARKAVADQLAADVETTEDAAHQLAYFEGIGALGPLLSLRERVEGVTATDVLRVAGAYLAPSRRTVGWYVPGDEPVFAGLGVGRPQTLPPREGAADKGSAMPGPLTVRLNSGMPAIVQRSDLSPMASVGLVVSGGAGEGPLVGRRMLRRSGMASELPAMVASLAQEARALQPEVQVEPSDDPEARLQQMIADKIGHGGSGKPQPVLAVVAGDVDPRAVVELLDAAWGGSVPAVPAPGTPRVAPSGPGIGLERATIARPLSQAAIGYLAQVPPPGTREGLATAMLLYILTHDYEGRLGHAAIGERGLVYYIGSDYRTDGRSGWISLSAGVDPEKQDAMQTMMRSQISALIDTLPSKAEVDAARGHLLGRDLSAAQSNDEWVDRLAWQYLAYGAPRDHATLAAELATIGARDVVAAARAVANGTLLRVDVTPMRGQSMKEVTP